MAAGPREANNIWALPAGHWEHERSTFCFIFTKVAARWPHNDCLLNWGGFIMYLNQMVIEENGSLRLIVAESEVIVSLKFYWSINWSKLKKIYIFGNLMSIISIRTHIKIHINQLVWRSHQAHVNLEIMFAHFTAVKLTAALTAIVRPDLLTKLSSFMNFP